MLYANMLALHACVHESFVQHDYVRAFGGTKTHCRINFAGHHTVVGSIPLGGGGDEIGSDLDPPWCVEGGNVLRNEL
jgi:hypothetical protein